MCRWKSGKESVECTYRSLTSIPEGINSLTQVLDLTGNSLPHLQSEQFLRLNLLNLQRIYLANCRINQISDNTFVRLTNLVDLDLGQNLLQAVPSNAFKDCPELRRLVLSGNPITRIESNSFIKLRQLTTLEMSRCRVRSIAPKAFDGLDELNRLKLDGNLLTSLKAGTVISLHKLHDIELHGNPWRCDCLLRDMRTWLRKNNIPYLVSPVCDQPKRLHGLEIDQLGPDELACEPRSESHRAIKGTLGEDAVLSCRVKAVPEPAVQWVRTGKGVIANMSVFSSGQQMYVILENGTNDKTSQLRITSTTDRDEGEYACIGENRAGQTVTNVTLSLEIRPKKAATLGGVQMTGLIMGVLAIGIALGCVFLVVRRRQREQQHVITLHKNKSSTNHVDFTVDSKCNSKLMKNPLLSNCTNSSKENDQASYTRNFLVNSLSGTGIDNTSGINSKPDVVNVDELAPQEGALRVREKRWSQCSERDGTTLVSNMETDSPVCETALQQEPHADFDQRTDSRNPRRALLRMSTSSDWAGSTQGLLAGSPQSSVDESSSSGSSRTAYVRGGDATLGRGTEIYRFRNSVPILPPIGTQGGTKVLLKENDTRRRCELGKVDL